jgi:hypothetical protein
MLTPFWVTFLCASFNGVAFLCAGLHQILLEPDRPNYPNGPLHQRVILFALMVMLGMVTVERFAQLYADTPLYTSPIIMTASGVFAAAQAVALEQQLRRWLPARIHERIRHLLNIASCRRRRALESARASADAALYPDVVAHGLPADVVGPALGAMTMDGMRAIGPGEGLEVFANLPPVGHPTPRESLGLQ